MKSLKILIPEGFTKTASVLISTLRIFGKPYGATGLGYSPKESLNLGFTNLRFYLTNPWKLIL